MSPGENPKTLADVREFIAGCSAHSKLAWKQQNKYNGAMEADMEGIVKRLSAVEHKVYWVSGFFAAVGGGIGAGLVKWLGS